MKRFPTFLPLALAASVTLAGCGDSKTEPSLSSDNRSERLQAVRLAQDKWGAHKRAKTADEEAIVGRWNLPPSAHFRLGADGTFTKGGLLNSIEGTYRLRPGGLIELSYPGIFTGRTVVWEMKYRLIGDSLELKESGFWHTWTKATP